MKHLPLLALVLIACTNQTTTTTTKVDTLNLVTDLDAKDSMNNDVIFMHGINLWKADSTLIIMIPPGSYPITKPVGDRLIALPHKKGSHKYGPFVFDTTAGKKNPIEFPIIDTKK